MKGLKAQKDTQVYASENKETLLVLEQEIYVYVPNIGRNRK